MEENQAEEKKEKLVNPSFGTGAQTLTRRPLRPPPGPCFALVFPACHATGVHLWRRHPRQQRQRPSRLTRGPVRTNTPCGE